MNRAGFGKGAFSHLSYTVLKVNSGILENKGPRVLSSETLSQTPDLENFALEYRLSKHVIDLA